MKRLYQKNELSFALVWIAIYVALMGAGDRLSNLAGAEKSVTAPISVGLTLALFWFLRRNGLSRKYGLCPFHGTGKQSLYFIPLVLIASVNLWNGVRLNVSVAESALYVLSMLCVGVLEELIFRGFLFRALCRDNETLAILISSVTFGIGHIVNLLNGADILPTLLQVCYASAIGFLFTVLFIKGGSLIPCMITHSAVNALSVFAVEPTSLVYRLCAAGALCAVSVLYALWILKHSKGCLQFETVI